MTIDDDASSSTPNANINRQRITKDGAPLPVGTLVEVNVFSLIQDFFEISTLMPLIIVLQNCFVRYSQTVQVKIP